VEQRTIKIFDTTLRDGEQTPGVCLDTAEKMEIAQTLAKMKVDIIEAGFPIASPGDFAAVSEVAAKVKGPTIAGLARANIADIDAAYKALKSAEAARIHTFIATSDLHLEYKLKMTRAAVLEAAEAAVRYARKYVEDVEFSAEDASRSDRDYLCQIIECAIRAGATTINIPDTVGYTTPEEFGGLIRYVRQHVPNIDKAAISVHCHNDLGMAVANSLAAIQNGANQVECTINGLGERAGNAAMEEIVMALHTRPDYYKATAAIDCKQIYKASRLVSILTGVAVQPNKAIVGENAFAHESGIHQHGMLNNPLTYEIMRPENIGLNRNALVLGKHSGKHAFEDRLKDMGYELSSDKVSEVFTKFKALADRKKMVFDRDIEALITEKANNQTEWYRLVFHQVMSGSNTSATSSVEIESNQGIVKQAACGDGPIDATFKAIEAATEMNTTLKDYQIKAVTSGEDALGEATVWLEKEGRVASGRGLSTDILEASAKAYVNALNKILTMGSRSGTNIDTEGN